MFTNPLARLRLFAVARGLLVLHSLTTFPAKGQSVVPASVSALTNLTQLARASAQHAGQSSPVQLLGDVWWADPAQGRLVLHDDTGSDVLAVSFRDESPKPGQRVRIEGNGVITTSGSDLRIGSSGAVVDNNGVHGMITKSGAVYLKAGLHPIRVEWFNGVEQAGLEVEYEGPGLSRQRIPGTALFRNSPNPTDASNLVSGVDYRCYDVTGEALPDFSPLTAIKSGVVPQFDLGILSRQDRVGVQFSGFLTIPIDGLYRFYLTSDDGSLLFVGEPSVRLDVIGTAALPQPNPIAIGQTLRDGEDRRWVEVEGRVTLARNQGGGLWLELSAGAGRLRVEVADASGVSAGGLMNRRIRAVGFCLIAHTTDGQQVPGLLLVQDGNFIHLIDPPAEASESPRLVGGELPQLTTAAEVHRLKREEAARGYPVKVRGVVTSVLPEHQAVTIQDATRGLYAEDHSPVRSGPPRIGELLEVEGATDPGLFAPIVKARRVESCGLGQLPLPVSPTWDQLMNGSLDAQYIEIQGVVTAVRPDGVTLLTRGGIIRVVLRTTGLPPADWSRFENAVVRVRGCLLATWDYATHQVKLGEVRIYDADVFVDQPAPADLFSTPAKRAAELLLFDPQASAFQRVKVRGQIVHVREPEYCLMDASNGLRFVTKAPAELRAGDQVEVVGFPDLFRSASPVLREAVVRRIGQANLPDPRRLAADDLGRTGHDATRVRVEGVLAGISKAGNATVLELQQGVRSFAAKLFSGGMPAISPGSRLELIGIYAALGGSRAAGQDIAAFELLLQSPADIKVLAHPPWWTLERLLITLGILACVLGGAALWITQLHRQVEQRTAELGRQIRERQRVEHQHAIEQERARIAQDLHDELGSGITEISMLAARADSAAAPEERRARHLANVRDKAREMVTALDEIVWAMNPGHDSLASLISYFSLYADRFLGLANIAWRLEGVTGPPDLVVDSRRRHQLFMVFKEALNNVVRHSAASEVRLGIEVQPGQLLLSVADDGRGVPSAAPSDDMNGVANMRARLEKLGGRFELISQPGRGTHLRFLVPLS